MAKNKDIISNEEIKDREKLVKEIKKEIKTSLIDELEEKIEGLIQVKIDKYEKKINKQKQRIILKKNIIIIILIVLVLFEGKLLYDNGILDKTNHEFKNDIEINNNISSEEDNSTKKDDNWYMENYGYLLDNIRINLNDEELLSFYKNLNKDDNIDNKIKLNMAYQNLSKEIITIKDGFITVDDIYLEDEYKKLFGENSKFKNEVFSSGCISFVYNKTLGKYLAVDIECEKNKKEVKEEIINIKEENNNIIITTVLGIYDTNSKTISNIEETFSEKYKDNLLDLEDKLDKLQYTFTIDDNNYFLNNITIK